MSTFWSGYITLLTLGTIAALFWLVFATRRGQRSDTTEQTLGHSFDGIEEYDNPLPKWWFMLFIGTLVFGLGYLVLYPGLGNWRGMLPGYDGGWTQDKQWQREVDLANAQYGPIFAKYSSMSVEQVAQDPEALKMGARLFANHCGICHGSDAKGALGFPDLTDAHWRWGGEPAAIKTTIESGRIAGMPAWLPVIGEQGVQDVASYVRHDLAQLPLAEGSKGDREAGKQLYATNCAACHGQNGEGMALMGAPNLTRPDGWIYGSSLGQLQQTIRHGRNGQMPAQQDYLGSDKIHVLAAYVYSLSHKQP